MVVVCIFLFVSEEAVDMYVILYSCYAIISLQKTKGKNYHERMEGGDGSAPAASLHPPLLSTSADSRCSQLQILQDSVSDR